MSRMRSKRRERPDLAVGEVVVSAAGGEVPHDPRQADAQGVQATRHQRLGGRRGRREGGEESALTCHLRLCTTLRYLGRVSCWCLKAKM